MMNDKNTRIVIPVHPGKDVKPRLIRAIKRPIIKEAGLNRENFLKLLKEKSGESNNRSYLPHI